MRRSAAPDPAPFRHDRVPVPAGIPGHAGAATVGDRALILDWIGALGTEAKPRHPPAVGESAVDRRLAAGQLSWFWEVAGEAVSFCWHSPVSGSVRVMRGGAGYK